MINILFKKYQENNDNKMEMKMKEKTNETDSEEQRIEKWCESYREIQIESLSKKELFFRLSVCDLRSMTPTHYKEIFALVDKNVATLKCFDIEKQKGEDCLPAIFFLMKKKFLAKSSIILDYELFSFKQYHVDCYYGEYKTKFTNQLKEPWKTINIDDFKETEGVHLSQRIKNVLFCIRFVPKKELFEFEGYFIVNPYPKKTFNELKELQKIIPNLFPLFHFTKIQGNENLNTFYSNFIPFSNEKMISECYY